MRVKQLLAGGYVGVQPRAGGVNDGLLRVAQRVRRGGECRGGGEHQVHRQAKRLLSLRNYENCVRTAPLNTLGCVVERRPLVNVMGAFHSP